MIHQNRFLPPREKLPQQPVRPAHSHSVSIGRKVASQQSSTAQRCYALPYPFPDGAVWAAIRGGVVMNMIYMDQPAGETVPFSVFRQRSRAMLAKEGEVWSGAVCAGRFVPKFESTDVRRGGSLNTARMVDR